ncbi:hypothetical protein [Yersinia phage vB_Yru_GN1]|uniref:Uncharacterized protein n=1 Tax=Yersinia phage vB_Yru_GN1 TaxID=3074381 RepID=A0AA86JCQ3_9CAUD|nr:hypothetical protein [Yersinia phage vB_Yru_GN1]
MATTIDPNSVISTLDARKKEKCLPKLEQALKDQGLSDSDIATMKSKLESVMGANITPEKVTEAFDDIKAEITGEFKPQVMELRQAQVKRKDQQMIGAYEVLDAKKSIKLSDPVIPESVGASAPAIAGADYSTQDDYPESYGFIDKVKNWLKINQKTKTAEIVHPSLTRIKVDGEGNALIYITGNAKFIVDGDRTDYVKGNYDLIVGGNQGNKVGGNVVENFGGDHNTTVGGTRNEKAATINHN